MANIDKIVAASKTDGGAAQNEGDLVEAHESP